jgi:guanylate kinase
VSSGWPQTLLFLRLDFCYKYSMNELKRIAEFRKILAGYKPSAHALEILKGVKLVLLLAPSAGGRNTIVDKLVAAGGYHRIISDTTRKPRTNDGVPEKSGREYWFRKESELLEDLRHGDFLEAEVIHGQQVSGISIRELEIARDAGEIAIDEVDIGGILNVLKLKSDTVPILILPPNFEEWQRRFTSRGILPADERRRRLETAARIFEAALQNDEFHLVINDDLEMAVEDVDAIARHGKLGFGGQKSAREIAERLYRDTVTELASSNENNFQFAQDTKIQL